MNTSELINREAESQRIIERDYQEQIAILRPYVERLRAPTMLEFGAFDGVTNSTIYPFLGCARRVVYIEPDFTNFAALAKNFGDRDEHVILVNALVSPRDGLRLFYYGAGQVSTSLETHHVSEWIQGEAYVAAISPDTLVRTLGTFDIVSIDTEGTDVAIMQQADKLLEAAQIVVAECGVPHGRAYNGNHEISIERQKGIQLLTKHGFKVILESANLIGVRE